MNNYQSGTFAHLAETPEGVELWEFLNGHDQVIRLETATYLKRPALEAIQPMLMERFAKQYQDKISGDRWKQMTGNMVRQVMEHRGYKLQQKNVKTRVPDLFTRGARYHKL